jgi:mono/diheme cytochrome c family protein
LNNQIATTKNQNQQTALSVLAGLVVVMLILIVAIVAVLQSQVSDPYMRNVLALEGDPKQGHAIFLMNCAGCHGSEAGGLVGPSLKGVSDRKSKLGLIHQVISGQTPPMPQFQPSPKEMADLLSYLEGL